MKKIYLFLILLIFVQTLKAQFFCLNGQKFEVKELALRAGLTNFFDVEFDVVNGKPSNIKFMDGRDKFSIDLYKEVTITNLNKILFFSDTTDVRWNIEYKFVSPRMLTNDYAEALSDNKIRFVFRKPEMQFEEHIIYKFANSDSLTLPGIIEFIEVNPVKSDILVERRFFNGNDTTIIKRNSHSILTEEILKLSKNYSLEDFQKTEPNAKYYFINFKIERNFRDCNYHKVY